MGVLIRWFARRAESLSGGPVPAQHDLQGIVRCPEDDVGQMVRALSAEVLLLRDKTNQFRGKGMVVTARGGRGARQRRPSPSRTPGQDRPAPSRQDRAAGAASGGLARPAYHQILPSVRRRIS